MPTPPPWWNETQEAPDATLSMQFRSGQSATVSVPSFIASVSRFGEATEPQSRWSRPITIAAALQLEHGFAMVHHRAEGLPLVALRIARAQRERLRVADLVRHVAVQGIVRARLVGQDVGRDLARDHPLEQVDGVARDADRLR